MVFESGGYGPCSIQRRLPVPAARRATCGSGSCSDSGSSARQRWCLPARLHAWQPQARMLCSCCAPFAPGWRSGATVGCCGRIPRSTGRRKRARAAATRLIASAMHVCVNARLSVRVPVHGVGESDRPNQMHSDMKYNFCEYLRPFAAREKHAAARARGRKQGPRREAGITGFMVRWTMDVGKSLVGARITKRAAAALMRCNV